MKSIPQESPKHDPAAASGLPAWRLVQLLARRLPPALGWRTLPLLAAWGTRLPRYRRRFIVASDDATLREYKSTFLPLAALHHELVRSLGEARALSLTKSIALDIATSIQRRWYLGRAEFGTWEGFHREHARQMSIGFIRHNVHTEPVVTPDRVEFQITRCMLFEAMSAMGIGALTEAFCHSDEIVFNQVVPLMRFHRGPELSNTIARGGPSCDFVFEREPKAR